MIVRVVIWVVNDMGKIGNISGIGVSRIRAIGAIWGIKVIRGI